MAAASQNDNGFWVKLPPGWRIAISLGQDPLECFNWKCQLHWPPTSLLPLPHAYWPLLVTNFGVGEPVKVVTVIGQREGRAFTVEGIVINAN